MSSQHQHDPEARELPEARRGKRRRATVPRCPSKHSTRQAPALHLGGGAEGDRTTSHCEIPENFLRFLSRHSNRRCSISNSAGKCQIPTFPPLESEIEHCRFDKTSVICEQKNGRHLEGRQGGEGEGGQLLRRPTDKTFHDEGPSQTKRQTPTVWRWAGWNSGARVGVSLGQKALRRCCS